MEMLVIHPQTKIQIDSYQQAPSHAVLLVGPTGSGKLTLAKQMAIEVLGLKTDSFDKYQYGLLIRAEEGKAIGIEAIRELEHFLSLKVPSRRIINRAIIIEDSHLLTPEAQNALLKTLEEPPADTVIILTADNERALLPTINSRVQTMTVRRPEKASLQAHFKQQGFQDKDIQQTFVMSGGLPGLMQALLSQDEHPLRAAAQQARQLLSQPLFERLVAVDGLSKQRVLTVDTVSILQQMAHISLQSANGRAAERWQKVLRASYDAADALQSSAQPKLALTDMVLQF